MEKLLDAMGKLAGSIIHNPRMREVAEREDKRYKNFLNKYRENINAAPKFNAAEKMQYFAGVMLGFMDSIFHMEEGKNDPLSNFGYFHEFFQSAFFDLCEQYKGLEKTYRFTNVLTDDCDELEKQMTECLRTVVRAPLNCREGLEILIYEGDHAYDLYRQMIYYF